MPGVELLFTVGGRRMRVTTDEVVQKLRGAKFGAVRTHAVKIEGVLCPVKEAFAVVTGLDRLDFNTDQARKWFRKLGFEVVRVDQASAESESGESVED